MAIDPIATYGAQILAKDGFRMTGDLRSGLKATVRYRIDWANVYQFLNAIIVPTNQTTIGLITYTLPYRLPAAVAATPVYASAFDIQPAGVRADLSPTTTLPYKGMAAGEYYQYGIVTVNFEQANFTWDALADDPNNLNQLDPSSPIPLCEQSVKFWSKMETVKGHRYLYVSNGKPVDGDFARPTSGADLTLRFPHVPYQPWQILNPYLNTVNSVATLGCIAGTLLFKPPDTVSKATLLGGNTVVEQSVTLTFGFNPDGWNKLPKPDGTLDDVVKAGGGSIYTTADWRPLFQQLAFTQASG